MNALNHNVDSVDSATPIVTILSDGNIIIHSSQMGEISIHASTLEVTVKDSVKKRYLSRESHKTAIRKEAEEVNSMLDG